MKIQATHMDDFEYKDYIKLWYPNIESKLMLIYFIQLLCQHVIRRYICNFSLINMIDIIKGIVSIYPRQVF